MRNGFTWSTFARSGPPLATLAPLLRASFSEVFQRSHPDVVERLVQEMLTTRQAT